MRGLFGRKTRKKEEEQCTDQENLRKTYIRTHPRVGSRIAFLLI